MIDAAEYDRATELLALDAGLRDEAERMLADSGLGAIIRAEGYQPVGSFSMRTMTWRDADFERTDEEPDWEEHWALGARLARLDWVWKLHCTHAYRQPEASEEGLYWGLRVSDPTGGPTWKVDLWTARREEFERGSPKRGKWESLLTDEARVRILAIKQAVCDRPEYRRDILSVHIYEAVLEQGVRGLDEFLEWHRARARDATAGS